MVITAPSGALTSTGTRPDSCRVVVTTHSEFGMFKLVNSLRNFDSVLNQKKYIIMIKFLIQFSGKEVGQLKSNSSVRTCAFSYSANLALFSTDKALGHQCELFIIDTRIVEPEMSQDEAINRISINGPRISAALWGALDETIITGHEDGEINLWDVRVSH